jgi:hypothetical protein
MATILLRAGTVGRKEWRQYAIIRDNSVVILDMVPAVLGWNVDFVTRQGDESWCGMTEAKIVAYKQCNTDRCDFGEVTGSEAKSVLSLEDRYSGVTGRVVRE